MVCSWFYKWCYTVLLVLQAGLWFRAIKSEQPYRYLNIPHRSVACRVSRPSQTFPLRDVASHAFRPSQTIPLRDDASRILASDETKHISQEGAFSRVPSCWPQQPWFQNDFVCAAQMRHTVIKERKNAQKYVYCLNYSLECWKSSLACKTGKTV